MIIIKSHSWNSFPNFTKFSKEPLSGYVHKFLSRFFLDFSSDWITPEIAPAILPETFFLARFLPRFLKYSSQNFFSKNPLQIDYGFTFGIPSGISLCIFFSGYIQNSSRKYFRIFFRILYKASSRDSSSDFFRIFLQDS